jgi:hypothetical protein
MGRGAEDRRITFSSVSMTHLSDNMKAYAKLFDLAMQGIEMASYSRIVENHVMIEGSQG